MEPKNLFNSIKSSRTKRRALGLAFGFGVASLFTGVGTGTQGAAASPPSESVAPEATIFFQLRKYNTAYSLDATSPENRKKGTLLKIYDAWSGNSNQHFQLIPLDGEDHYALQARDSNYCVTGYGDSNFAPIILEECRYGDYQQWKLMDVASKDGYYRLVNGITGFALDGDNGGGRQTVHSYENHPNNTNQWFKFTKRTSSAR